MKGLTLTQSRFRGVYVGLFLIGTAAILAICVAIDSWIVPQVLRQRVASAEALVHSHHEELLFKDNRALRDELLAQNLLSNDLNFDEFFIFKDMERIQGIMNGCKFVSESTCVNQFDTLIFSGAAKDGLKDSSFAIHLRSSYFSSVQGAALWKILGSMAVAALLGIVAWAIRQQETFLVKRIALLAESQSKIESLFRIQGERPLASEVDEFSLISNSIDQAAAIILNRTEQIEDYKRRFERKTELEQLAKTISYSSHNLKAPFLEGADFFRSFPNYLETMPKERLLRMGSSLEKRFHLAADSLQKALSATRRSYMEREPISLIEILQSFKRGIEDHPQHMGTTLTLNNEKCSATVQVLCSAQEMDAVFWNLFKNSLEMKADAEIAISAKTQDNFAIVTFQDNGPGIAQSDLSRIFDDFYTTKGSGTGLGLGSVKSVIEQFGGAIAALPSISGAIFEIRLPIYQTQLPISPSSVEVSDHV